MMSGLQKLLHPGMSAQIVERGYDRVGGFVIDVADAGVLPTPQALLSAFRLGGEWGEWVDVVRFDVPACAQLRRPDSVERPWPTYPSGFLTPVGDAIVPVMWLSTTRYPAGAELWRIHADGRQEHLLWYAGAARGWVGARGWSPPSRYVGLRATWQEAEYAADLSGGEVALTTFDEPSADGWLSARPQTWSRSVPADQCELFEIVFSATVDDVAVRVLAFDGTHAQVEVVSGDPDEGQRIGAGLIDLGILVASPVPASSLRETQLVANVRRG